MDKRESTGQSKPPFSAKMKIADLVMANYRLLPVLERMGAELGFGEKSVEQVCEGLDFSPDFFLLICNIHSHDDFLPRVKHLGGAQTMKMIVDYLHNSHEYYITRRIPYLKSKLEQMIENCEPKHKAVIGQFFDNYQNELLNHFDYEEKNVFPYIRKLFLGESTGGYSIAQFEENHSNIDEKLNDLKSIILKYLPASCNVELRSEVLFDIFQLEEDIQKHTLIEERVMIPLVEQLEKSIKAESR